tara:strand:- start:333 stop:692 length:360 start_codon:yes stop_codon:yes gene_type:complete
MALGNNSGKGTARHKGQIKQSIKERKNANSFIAFSTTVAETNTTRSCAISNSDINVPYFHDGSHVSNLPYQVGDKVYTRKRNNSKFYLADGFYKIGPDRGRYFSIKITNGAVASISTCP